MRHILLVIIAFLLLGISYSVAVPIFEAPDELQHYATTEYIARFKWLPPLGKPTEHLWDQEALQAPLYYIITGALTSWVDTSDFSQQAILQPKTNFGDAELPGKKILSCIIRSHNRFRITTRLSPFTSRAGFPYCLAQARSSSPSSSPLSFFRLSLHSPIPPLSLISFISLPPSSPSSLNSSSSTRLPTTTR
jgi:hypothetical protein